MKWPSYCDECSSLKGEVRKGKFKCLKCGQKLCRVHVLGHRHGKKAKILPFRSTFPLVRHVHEDPIEERI